MEEQICGKGGAPKEQCWGQPSVMYYYTITLTYNIGFLFPLSWPGKILTLAYWQNNLSKHSDSVYPSVWVETKIQTFAMIHPSMQQVS